MKIQLSPTFFEELVQLLNHARSSGGPVVGNINLAGRVVRLITRHLDTTEAPLPEVKRISVIGLRPGDVVVLETDKVLSREQRATIATRVGRTGLKMPVLILEDGMRFSVARPTTAGAPDA